MDIITEKQAEEAQELIDAVSAVKDAAVNAMITEFDKHIDFNVSKKDFSLCCALIREAIGEMLHEDIMRARHLIQHYQIHDTQEMANEHRTY